MTKTMANVWGGQTEINLGTWEEIKALGLKKRDRAFGHLNDNTSALFFYKWEDRTQVWYVTTEKLEYIND